MEEHWVGKVLLDRYHIVDQIDAGGVAAVFRAEQPELSRHVAVKILAENLEGEDRMKARFEREARALAALSHPHTVHLLDFGVAEGRPFLVMELLRGQPLEEAIANETFDFKRAVSIIRQVLHALAFAHGHGIVHRDIKPGNIFLEELPHTSDHVRVLDFGFAKFFAADDERQGEVQTMAGTTFGTPGYVAPEQLGETNVDGRADLYAAGVILYQMLAGRRPFEGTAAEMLRGKLTQAAPALSSMRPELQVVPALDALLNRVLERDPDDRFATSQQMLEALEALPQQSVQGASGPSKAAAAPEATQEVTMGMLVGPGGADGVVVAGMKAPPPPPAAPVARAPATAPAATDATMLDEAATEATDATMLDEAATEATEATDATMLDEAATEAAQPEAAQPEAAVAVLPEAAVAVLPEAAVAVLPAAEAPTMLADSDSPPSPLAGQSSEPSLQAMAAGMAAAKAQAAEELAQPALSEQAQPQQAQAGQAKDQPMAKVEHLAKQAMEDVRSAIERVQRWARRAGIPRWVWIAVPVAFLCLIIGLAILLWPSDPAPAPIAATPAELPVLGPAVEEGGLWASPLPEPLASAHTRLMEGEDLAQESILALRRYGRENTDAPQPWLLIGHTYVERHWYSDALEQYETANRANPSAREDPFVADNLLRMFLRPRLANRAFALAQEMYPDELGDLIDARLDDESLRPAQKRRLEALRGRLD